MKHEAIIHIMGTIRHKANTFILDELAKHNITGIVPSHGAILKILARHHELSMKEIAHRINRKKSTVTTLIEKLIKLGYVQKKTDTNDSRVSLISLTDKTRELQPLLDTISEKMLEKTYKDITDQEKKFLEELLEKIKSNFE